MLHKRNALQLRTLFPGRHKHTTCLQQVSLPPPISRCITHQCSQTPAGVEPTNVGFLRPLVSKATARDAVQQQKGCDDATDTGLTNTITWHMDQVDPAVLEDLVAKVRKTG